MDNTPLVTRLLKGRYQVAKHHINISGVSISGLWRSQIVSLGENSQLSLKQLSQKLVILMALVQASMSSELHALDVRFRVYKLDGVVFTPNTDKEEESGHPGKRAVLGCISGGHSIMCDSMSASV